MILPIVGWIWVIGGIVGMALLIKYRGESDYPVLFTLLAALEIIIGAMMVRGNL